MQQRTPGAGATWFPPERPGTPFPGQPDPGRRRPEWQPPGWEPAPPLPSSPPQWPAQPPLATPPATPAEDIRELWEDRLLDQRIVLVNGVLDAERASRTASRLLLLESRGRQPVTLRLDSPNADLTAVWTLVDTLDALAAPVHALVVGELGGGSLALLTAAAERYAHPHARFRLADPSLPHSIGTAGELAGEAAANQSLVDAFHQRLADLTGHSAEQISDDFRRGRFLPAPAAVDYGLVTALRPQSVRPD
jgi:ATP-dependent Clp protease protease subunit